MKKLFKKIMSGVLTLVIIVTSALSGITLTYATPTNTGDKAVFQPIPSNDKWLKDINRKGGYSSTEDAKKDALTVKEEYAYKLFRKTNTSFTVLKGTTAEPPESFNGDKLDPALTDDMKTWKWFNLSNTDNTAGKIEVKISNLRIYQEDVKKWITVDVVRTITAIDRNTAVSGGWIGLGDELTDTIYIGVDEVTTENTFYKSGTNEKISLKSNVTLADIDVYQYAAVKKSQVTGHYVSGNTSLYYGEKDRKSYYASRNDTNYHGNPRSYVAFTFEGNSFTYTFGKWSPEKDEGGNIKLDENHKEIPLPPTNQYQYLATGQNMTRLTPGSPSKTVSDPDNEGKTHNTLDALSKQWTYYVDQPVPTDQPENFYYDSFQFRDDIDTCLNILSVRVFATDKNGDESDVTNWFEITKDNNQVRASMKKNHLDNANTYQMTNYRLAVEVEWYVPDDFDLQNPAYMEKWREHNHFVSAKKLKVNNKATVVIDGDAKDTPETTTEVNLPELHITKDVDRYEYQVGDKINYTVKVWNSNPDAKLSYYWIRDISLPDTVKLDPESIKVTGPPAELFYTLEQTGNGWVIKSNGGMTLQGDTVITVTYSATALKEGNGTLVDNTAVTGSFGIPEISDSEQVYINSPKIDVRKEAEQRKYKVGDVVAYTVDIDNRNPGTFMREIHLHDLVTTPGLKIKEGTVAVLVGGKDVTSTVDITFNDNGTGFDIKTPYNLKSGTIPCIDKAPYNTIENWIDKIKVTYDAVITSEAGETCDNTFGVPATPNTNGDIIRDDPDVPSGGGSDDEKVPLKAPQLEIIKSSDKTTYKVGDTGTYTLQIKQIKEELTARNVVVKDQFEQSEGVYYFGSMKVHLNKEDITGKCDIAVEGNTFTIKTNSDLTDEDKLTVTYNVKFEQTGTYKNMAVASSDNTNEDDDDNTVTVEGAVPKLDIEKTSDKETYKVGNTGKYTLQIKETVPGAVAENVVITDSFKQTKGVKIDEKSIKVLLDGKNITPQCKITAKDAEFRIETNADLSGDKLLVVSYDVHFLESGTYKNVAAASSDNTLEYEDDNTVEVVAPKLEIIKSSDKKKYKVGDTGKYTLQIKETVPGAVAENVVITDSFKQIKGVKIDEKSIKVLLGGKNITSQCKITAKKTGFTIKTNKNLTADELLIVTYKVKFEKDGKYKNTAIAKSDNTPDADSSNDVIVPKDDPGRITANTPDKNPDGTGSSYTAPKTGGNAINIAMVICLIVIICALIGVIIIRKKKLGKKS